MSVGGIGVQRNMAVVEVLSFTCHDCDGVGLSGYSGVVLS